MFKNHSIVMLPTENASNIVYNNNANGLFYDGMAVLASKRLGNCENQHIYILSDDEIKIGDHYYFKWAGLQSIHECFSQKEADEVNGKRKTDFDITNCAKKVISSSDKSLNLPQPSDHFVKHFCEVQGMKEVMVDYIDVWGKGTKKTFNNFNALKEQINKSVTYNLKIVDNKIQINY